MGLHHIRELRAQFQLGQPERHLIGAELAMGQLHIQQPVIQVGGLRPCAVEQEFLLWLLAQQSVLDAVLVVGQFQFFDTEKLKRLEVAAQLLLVVVPKDNPVPLKEFGQGLGDALNHEIFSTSNESERLSIKHQALMGPPRQVAPRPSASRESAGTAVAVSAGQFWRQQTPQP